MAICDLSNRNPNVLYELGLRQAYDKPVVLIQDDKTNKIFDVSGISTVFYKSARLYEDVLEARENIKKAILSTKEGKVSSLAKVMKVSVADFSKVEVSQDDKTNVILEGIYNEINELKNKVENNYLCSDIRKPFQNNYNQWKVSKLVVKFYGIINNKIFSDFYYKLRTYVVGLLEINIMDETVDQWTFEFILSNYENMKAARSQISEIATEFNIECAFKDIYP